MLFESQQEEENVAQLHDSGRDSDKNQKKSLADSYKKQFDRRRKIVKKSTYVKRQKKCPKFILSLYQMIQDHHHRKIICWNQTNDSIIINKQRLQLLTNQLLPKYFKHGNYQSFVRQLNMYNFIKVKQTLIENIESVNYQIFQHKNFYKNNFKNFNQIKRKPVKPQKQFVKNVQNRMDSEKQQITIFSRKNCENKQKFNLQNILDHLNELNSQQNQLESQCLDLLHQNHIIMTQNNSIMQRIQIEARNKQRVISQLIKLIALAFQADSEYGLIPSNLQNQSDHEENITDTLSTLIQLMKQTQMTTVLKAVSTMMNSHAINNNTLSKKGNYTIVNHNQKKKQSSERQNVFQKAQLIFQQQSK